MSMSRFLMAFLAAATLSLEPQTQTDAATGEGGKPPTALAPDEQDFVITAASSTEVELRSGRIAVEHAAHQAVRKFGQRMVDENAGLKDRVQKLAAAKGISLPVQLTDKQKALLERLQGLSGADFDRAYMGAMVDAHHHEAKVFGEAAEQSRDQLIKAFAIAELPIVREHLQLARDVAAAIGAPLSPLAGYASWLVRQRGHCEHPAGS